MSLFFISKLKMISKNINNFIIFTSINNSVQNDLNVGNQNFFFTHNFIDNCDN
jgi:hypothetical protein